MPKHSSLDRRKHTLVRQHVFKGERLQLFSDAVFSIIATFMVIPLKPDETVRAQVQAGNFDLQRYFLVDQWPRYLVYFYSFSLVADIWLNHVRIFVIIEKVNDVLLGLNLLLLGLVSFLPYSTALVSSYPFEDTAVHGEHLAIVLCALDIVLISIVKLVMILYAFCRKSFLEQEAVENIKKIRLAVCVTTLAEPVTAILALVFALVIKANVVGAVFLYAVVPVSILSKVGLYLYIRCVAKARRTYVFSQSKVRTEGFSDGVFAIVATLLILELTTEDLPSRNKGVIDLKDALEDNLPIFLAYATDFILVGLLWFIHYGNLYFIKKMTPLLTGLNLATLFLVGLIPYLSKVNTLYSDVQNDGENRATAVRGMFLLVFTIGTSQLIFWTAALCMRKKCLSHEIYFYNSENLQICKLLVLPILSFCFYWLTFYPPFIQSRVYGYIIFLTPLIFLIIRTTFFIYAACKPRKRQRRRQKSISSDNEPDNDVHIITDSTSDFQGRTAYSDYNNSRTENSQGVRELEDEDNDSILYSEEGVDLMEHLEPVNTSVAAGPPGIMRAMKSQVADTFQVSGSWHERSHTYHHYDTTMLDDESCDNQVQDT